MKIVLSGGYYYKASDRGESFCKTIVDLCGKKTPIILDCLFGRKEGVYDRFQDDQVFFKEFIPEATLLLAGEEFVDQIQQSDMIFFQGGNPSLIIKSLESFPGWTQYVKEKVLVGTSGGADVLAKYYGVGKTMRIGEGLGLLDIKFIPHWKSQEDQFGGIEWDVLRERLLSHQEDIPTICLGDSEYKVF